MMDHGLGLCAHTPPYAIIAQLSQPETCDNRHCDGSTAVRNYGMAGLRPETAAIFERLDATGATQRENTMPHTASFSDTEVRFGGRDLAYVISRVDLSIRRTIRILGKDDTGRCTMKRPPKRAF